MCKFKRIIAVLLSVAMVIPNATIIQAGDTLPDGGNIGTGSVGPWNSAAIFIKADFFKPSQYGLTSTNYKEIISKIEGSIEPESLNEAALFIKGSGYNNIATMQDIWASQNGTDSKQLGQMYLYGNFGFVPIRFLYNKTWITADSTGQYGISPESISGCSGQLYKSDNGILSLNNLFMEGLLKATDNGKNWDGEGIAKEIDKIYNTYVSPSSSGVNNGQVVAYRRQFASMFYGTDGSTGNWPDAAAYINDLFTTKIKPGVVPPGATFTVESEEQAMVLKNLIMVVLALVFSNPGAGLQDSKVGVIPADTSFKGDLIKRQLQTWARCGGNSDKSDYHFSFKLEAYGMRGFRTGQNIVVRWDQSFLAATNQSVLSKLSLAPNFDKDMKDINRYGFNAKFNLSTNGIENHRILAQSMIDAHKAMGLNISRNGIRGDDGSDMSVFQIPYISTSGKPSSASSPGYGFRSIVQMNSPIFYEGKQTMNIGYAYLSPPGAFRGIAQEVAKPNLLIDAVLFSDEQELAPGMIAKASSYIDFKWAPPYSEDLKNEYELKFESDEWNAPEAEELGMLKLIERCKDTSQIASGAEFSKLPIKLTIKRTIENGSGKSDGKILDEMYDDTTIVKMCGKHDFKIVSDDGNTAVITFNLIPSSECTYDKSQFQFESPLKISQGKTGVDCVTTINNCAVYTLMHDASSRIKFNDVNIGVNLSPGAITTVHYDYSMEMKSPTFKENKSAYGDSTMDKMMNNPIYTALGYSSLPIEDAVYPDSDWVSGFYRSKVIRRSINFFMSEEVPMYTNYGYEKKMPYYAEIKQGSPSNEQFEAMAGTPTTRDLYVSVGATDFRVDFNADKKAVLNPKTERVYEYIVTVKGCTGTTPTNCAGGCGTCAKSCPGHKTQDGTTYHDNHKDHTIEHPEDHTWTYRIHVPIEGFTYFDMKNSELWRLTSWGLSSDGSESQEYLVDKFPEFEMGTQCWALNVGNYDSMCGRIIFSDEMNSNEEDELSKFGDNTREFTVSGTDGCNAAVKEAVPLVNDAKSSEKPFTGTIISDYMVLKTSEGYQVPYFFKQDFMNKVDPSTVGQFSGKGGDLTTKDSLKVEKQLTIDDFWWKNTSKSTCGSRDNFWNNTSITFGGYNGDYSDVKNKYINTEHDNYMSSKNPLQEALSKYKISIDGKYPNQARDGSGDTPMLRDKANRDHIKTGLDVIDETPNGEYNTGEAYAIYKRVMMYSDNKDKGALSSFQGKFDGKGGVDTIENIPYFDGADNINDIVIHNPVSTQYSVVLSNDKKYDSRTNDKLMQGGDPIGLMGGVCPAIGCQFSNLNCGRELESHTNDCYSEGADVVEHNGGLNIHVHADECLRPHDESCYTTMYEWAWLKSSCEKQRDNDNYTTAWTNSDSKEPTSKPCWWSHPRDERDWPDVYFKNCHWYPTGKVRKVASDGTTVEQLFYITRDWYQWDEKAVRAYSIIRSDRSSNYIDYDVFLYDIEDDGNITMEFGYKGRRTGLSALYGSEGAWGRDPVVDGVKIKRWYNMYVSPDYPEQNRLDPPALSVKKGQKIYLSFNAPEYSENTLKVKINYPGSVLCEKHANDQYICNPNIPNTHKCTNKCVTSNKKILICSDPHHYVPGEPTDITDPKFHYPIGDTRCWERCGIDANHGTTDSVTLPDGSTAKMGGTFINLDREFKIYYPFVGDFAEEPRLNGIASTTETRGKGFTNKMNTEEWTEHRWVLFPVNVIDPNGEMRLAYTQIDLNEFSTTDEEFTFYCVLANDEQAEAGVKFTSVANNAPTVNKEVYFDESIDITNKERIDWKYAARHTAAKFHYIDVVGYIGALTIHDTGDFRFSNFFKKAKTDGSFLIPNLVPEVELNIPNFIVSDNITARRDGMSKDTDWLDTYGKAFNLEGGKSGGTDNAIEPYLLPLVPRYNNIPSLRNQPMRPGYQLYMDNETIGNYYGETTNEEGTKFVDSQMHQKMQIRPTYYSLDLNTGEYTPVDVYYGVNGEFMQVNDYDYNGVDPNSTGVKDFYLYLDWLNESARRNYTQAESESTSSAKNYRQRIRLGNGDLTVRVPSVERDVIGSANLLFLNDLNRTFIGSSKTYGEDRNPGELLQEEWYNMQSQRWQFTLGLPSSSVFVEAGEPCTETNISKLQSKDRVIVCTIDIKVQGEVWTLKYDGTSINSLGFQIYEGGRTYDPPMFDEEGNPTTDPDKDVTSDKPIVVIYPSDKTSKDDVSSAGIQ